MRQVPGPDAAFLSGETSEWHFHVSALTILETEDSDRYSFAGVRDTLARRIHRVPQFRWKLHPAPMTALARPYWVDDENFDIDWHLNHIALPTPGDDRALSRLVGRLLSSQIDRTRPLWEMWLIDGLEGGRSALLAKIHHSIIDGQSGAELATLLFDLEADPAPEPEPAPWTPEPPPGSNEIVGDIVRRASVWPYRIGQMAAQFASQSVTYARHTFGDQPTTHPFQAPRVSINGKLTPSRSFASASVSLDEAKSVKNAFGVKLNDVIVAIVAGVLRSYLIDRSELPDTPLVAQIPVSMRIEDDAHIGTKVSMMFAAMATDVEDPGERLLRIGATTSAAKEMRAALTAQQIMSLTENTPPALVSLAALAWTAGGLDSSAPPVFNTIVSNIPGPPFDFYLAGARVQAMFPMGPLLFGSGLNFTVVSNATRLDVGVLACPDLVPDAWDVAGRVQPALDELVEAAASLSD
ncbi:MAG: wax ester/triacylglycerol synthase family O-acyltransferase [Actinobacteria bacterium]|nr:wax ester/triacylglycerol synthase family O-acyltransferase [Actinomycetota bacterium]